ncbi:hypothetical Protein YC6258_01342 [Gynuella sunshinyii YC6258]|uniref:Uncharacterized protein n=1 Tax=Gynuella sunshinyii YC6258 TaxID=1445510 RepID=A0A0C5V1H5_9GAMM|nr:hypothetical Protein YC6258_01342 [Gynuella sunshinyii YC6258]
MILNQPDKYRIFSSLFRILCLQTEYPANIWILSLENIIIFDVCHKK